MASVSTIAFAGSGLGLRTELRKNMKMNQVCPFGRHVSRSLAFAKPERRTRGGGPMHSVAGEITQIALVMNGLVLIGVAVGFVLLRVEAALEESE